MKPSCFKGLSNRLGHSKERSHHKSDPELSKLRHQKRDLNPSSLHDMSVSGDFDSDANSLGGSSSSFWDIKQYGRTVKRVDNANKLCSELCNLIHERAEIEKTYSSSLKKWATRWQSFLDSGPEYGTTQSAWKGVCKEADRLSEMHQEMRTKLVDDIHNQIKHWQKEHFHKSALPPQSLKETKNLEVEFETAQKPWAKRHKRVQQCKKDYHNACKMVRSYETQVNNASCDGGAVSEQIDGNTDAQKRYRKLQDKLKKAEKDVEKTKSAYESSLKDLDSDSSRYMEDMTTVFKKSQEMEQERLDYFKTIFYQIHEVLNISNNSILPETYKDFRDTIDQVTIQGDLNWWSENHGVDMQTQFPVFEDYAPELQSISKKKVGAVVADSGVNLTAVTASETTSSRQGSFRANNGASQPVPTSEHHPPINSVPPPPPASGETHPRVSYDETLNPFGGPLTVVKEVPKTQNPFNEEPEGEHYCDNLLEDDGRPGVKVRALYDYVGAEEDEISFKAGEVFEKLEDEDEQGWCKGRKDARVGLYPANYVESI